MIFLMLFFLLGSVVLGVAWILIFWVASFVFYLWAWILSLFGFYIPIGGENNVWLLFFVVIGISYWIFTLEGSNFGYAVFVFLSGLFMLFRSADVWRIGTG